ncbi:HAD-IA family hydrolase [Candidatus Woesearchaeota archaeon]|nr:HAD-IA family hydrolase [Candidatus Woesearchaeota archaeon]
MKAVLLAAGSGSRIKPFSLTKSKVMLSFLGKPLLFYHIDEFLENGIDEVIIVCNSDNVAEIKKEASSAYPHVRFAFCVQDEQLGPSHAIYCAKDFIAGDEFFLFKYADSVSGEALVRALLDCFHSAECDGAVTLRQVDEPSRYGIARIENGRVVEIVEKPGKDAPSDLALVGVGILRSVDFIKGVEMDELFVGKKEVAPPEYVLRQNGHLNYWVYNGKREDLGKPWDVLLVNRLLISRFDCSVSGSVHSSAQVGKDCFVSGNAVVGANSEVRNCSSVEGVVGRNCVIDNSMIMKGTVIGDDCHIINSVIGENNSFGNGFVTRTSADDALVFVKDHYEKPPIARLGLFTGSNVIVDAGLFSEQCKIVYPDRTVKKNIVKDCLIRAVVFDADNTLYNTKDVAEQADMVVMKFMAMQTNKTPEELYHYWKSKIVDKLKNENDPKKRHRLFSYNLLAKEFRVADSGAFRLFLERLLYLLRPLQGVEDVLNSLKRFKLAVVSEDSSDMLLAKLMKLGLRSYFDVVVSSDKIGVMKPNGAYLAEALRLLNVVPQECLVVGDDYEKDIALWKQKGAVVVCFNCSGNSDFSIKDYSEFGTILEDI